MYFRTTYLHSACLAIALLSCAPLGTRPSDEDVERFSTSQHYNVEKKQFENRLPNVMEAMNRRVYSMDSFKAWMDGPEQGRPPGPLPTQQADIEAFSAPDGSLKIIWLGHSSFLLNMAGRIILVDPIFSQAASPVSLFVRRFQEPPIPLKALPPIDFILISHDHYDHLDMETTEFFVERETRFIVPRRREKPPNGLGHRRRARNGDGLVGNGGISRSDVYRNASTALFRPRWYPSK